MAALPLPAVVAANVRMPLSCIDGASQEPAEDGWRENMPSHRHTALPARSTSIRLLEIHLGPAYEHVRCTLSQHNMHDTPSFVALSYTWNQSSRRRHIDCDGMDLEIGENLWHFLHEFRKKHSIQQYQSAELERKVPCLWIDAICIDQSNLEERNQQVAQMRDVYTSAESVIVWLGVAQGNEELVYLLAKHPDLHEVKQFQDELLVLLNKPYFTRVWVVQEFVLAKAVVIWCSEFLADADAFDTILHEGETLRGSSERFNSILRTPAWPLFHYRRNFRRGGPVGSNVHSTPSFQLCDLLLSFDSSQSSEAYDRIYGFLGIAQKPAEDTHPIHPDYSKSPVEILADVLRNQCCRDGKAASMKDHELLNFLMRILRVSRIEFARYLSQRDPSMTDHLHFLTTLNSMAASICKVGSVKTIGAFEHISGLSPRHMQIALSDSATSLPELSTSTIRLLSLAIAEPETALGLECAKGGRADAVSQKTIKNLIQSIAQKLSSEGIVNDSSADPELRLSIASLQKSLYASLIESSKELRPSIPLSRQQEIEYLHRRYATFVGTNDMVGVICDESSMGREPTVFDDIYVFADDLHSNRALIVDGRRIERLVIVGTAMITTSVTDTGSPRIAQSWQRLFRTGSGETARSMSASSTSLNAKYETTKVCLHCQLTELLELIRCGILNENQLRNLLRELINEAESDEVHICNDGTGQYPSLRFGA